MENDRESLKLQYFTLFIETKNMTKFLSKTNATTKRNDLSLGPSFRHFFENSPDDNDDHTGGFH